MAVDTVDWIDVLAAMTGLDFFPEADVDEDVDTWEMWEAEFATMESGNTE